MRRGSYGRGIRFQSAGSSSGGAAIPPPPSCQVNSRGFSTLESINEAASSLFSGVSVLKPGGPGTGLKKVQKRNHNEEDYFEEEDEPLAYIPAPGSPSYKGPGGDDEEDEDDPLDAFMAGIEKQVKKEQNPELKAKSTKPGDTKGVRDDIEAEDDEETYYRFSSHPIKYIKYSNR